MRSRLLAAIFTVSGVLVATTAAAEPATDEAAVWQVTITNLTPLGPGGPGSQPLSPPLVAVHGRSVHVWQTGEIASHGVAAIAEDAYNAVLAAALPKLRGVRTVFTATAGPIPSGGSATFQVRLRPHDRLSVVTMLVNTNDAFTGLDSLAVSGARRVVRTISYDAGSEVNNERTAFIPGPCCNNPFARAPEGNVIRPHEGITGRGDLDPTLYDWPEPVARFTIQPVD